MRRRDSEHQEQDHLARWPSWFHMIPSFRKSGQFWIPPYLLVQTRVETGSTRTLFSEKADSFGSPPTSLSKHASRLVAPGTCFQKKRTVLGPPYLLVQTRVKTGSTRNLFSEKADSFGSPPISLSKHASRPVAPGICRNVCQEFWNRAGKCLDQFAVEVERGKDDVVVIADHGADHAGKRV